MVFPFFHMVFSGFNFPVKTNPLNDCWGQVMAAMTCHISGTRVWIRSYIGRTSVEGFNDFSHDLRDEFWMVVGIKSPSFLASIIIFALLTLVN